MKRFSAAILKFRHLNNYRRMLNSPDGKQFLAYMKKRLVPHDTPFHKDPVEMGRRVGHQEAFMLMCQLVNMTDEQMQHLKESTNV